MFFAELYPTGCAIAGNAIRLTYHTSVSMSKPENVIIEKHTPNYNIRYTYKMHYCQGLYLFLHLPTPDLMPTQTGKPKASGLVLVLLFSIPTLKWGSIGPGDKLRPTRANSFPHHRCAPEKRNPPPVSRAIHLCQVVYD